MYNKTRKIEKKYLILISLIVVTIFLGFAIKIINRKNLTNIEKIVKDSSFFVYKIAYFPIRFVTNEINKAKTKQDIYNKYKELLNQKEEIQLISTKNEELNRELKQMKELLELNSTLDKESYLNATVINRNIDYFSNSITLDKGDYNGVRQDMAVITKNGLIGKIIKTTNFTSTVKLLTSDDINNKISVKININDQYIYGLLSGYNKKKQTLLIEGIDNNEEIPLNSIVTTTGLGNIFPSGILIGKVENVTKDNFDLTRIIEVKSNVNFDDLAFVTILKRNSDD